ncbi:flagellar hook-length control protein FliK [Pseudidiomarina gelatinasegens]|uniref:Flagellar hook-length control protein FliK n=1 Tax=Pseudidiomarina gelatinasegens TaxID=2487740 RepID=A0A443YZG8_9GAMM|nr:flagellar hook-length control protein FliK [Pseudidiomarina gelatinasegens]RWU09605.1 flagellar hook-length control protein FliK [Pseudidiomarina gelatinasegens]
MVTIKGLTPTAPAATGTQQDAPSSGFAALFAAVQAYPQKGAQNLNPQALALQQLEQRLAGAGEPALELDELSAEALQQLVTQLEQLRELSADATPSAEQQALMATVAQAATTKASALAHNVAAENLVKVTPPTVSALAEQTAPATPVTAQQAQLDSSRASQPIQQQPVLAAQHEQTAKPATFETVKLKLDQTTPIEAPRPSAPSAATSMTAQVVMVDAPVATPSTTAATATQAPPAAALSAQVGSTAWANQLQQNVLQMVVHNQQEMTLRLHPAELGPLQVQLRVDEHTAKLNIFTHSHHVRGALEQALPQLRDALANQGIQLDDSQVNDNAQQFAQQQERQQAQQWAMNQQKTANNSEINTDSAVENSESAENTDMGSNSRHTAAPLNGQVDIYA